VGTFNAENNVDLCAALCCHAAMKGTDTLNVENNVDQCAGMRPRPRVRQLAATRTAAPQPSGAVAALTRVAASPNRSKVIHGKDQELRG
jgi:hypothetical protein